MKDLKPNFTKIAETLNKNAKWRNKDEKNISFSFDGNLYNQLYDDAFLLCKSSPHNKRSIKF